MKVNCARQMSSAAPVPALPGHLEETPAADPPAAAARAAPASRRAVPCACPRQAVTWGWHLWHSAAEQVESGQVLTTGRTTFESFKCKFQKVGEKNALSLHRKIQVQ